MPSVPDLEYTPTLPVLLRRLVERYGDADFLVSPERRLTYREADLQSKRVALRLLSAGCVKGTRIAFMFGNTPDWVVLWLAICRIGAIGMPLSTMYRPAELRQVLGLADAEILVSPRVLLGRDQLEFLDAAIPGLAGSGAGPHRLPSLPFLRRVMIEGEDVPRWAERLDLWSDLGDDQHEFLGAVEAAIYPADTMVAVFTSGTTAEPKGVLHTHGAFVRHTSNCADSNDEPSGERIFAGMPFFWVGGLSTTIGIAMHRGHALLCIEKPEPAATAEFLVREGCTRAMLWPTQMERVKAAMESSGLPLPPFARAQPEGAVEPGRRAQSMGMTETLAAYTVTGPAGHRIPDEYLGAYGFKVPYLEYRIVDPDTGTALGEGEEGEICVRGYSLMVAMCRKERHEYLDDDGWYHTGDRGSLKGPYVYFNGRLKDLIKTSGANVSPREVEAVINGVDGVLTSIVVGIPDPVRQEVVAALVAPRPGAAVGPAEVVSRCRELLSSYKVPRRIALVSDGELPVGATGKAKLDEVRRLVVQLGADV